MAVGKAETTNPVLRMWRAFRSLMLWLLFALVAVAGAGGVYLFFRADEELRLFCERALVERYPHLDIQVGEAKLLQGEGIRLRQVSVVDPQAGNHGERQELAFVNEILIRCQPGPQDLLHGKLQIQHLALRGLTLRATRLANGTWDLVELLRPPQLAGEPPTASIEASTLELVDRTGAQPRILRLEDLELTAAPRWQPVVGPDAVQVDPLESAALPRDRGHEVVPVSYQEPSAKDAASAAVRSAAQPTSRSTQQLVLDVQGTFRNQLLRRGELRAQFVPSTRVWEIQGGLDELVISPELARALPANWLPMATAWEHLQARVALDFSITRGLDDPMPQFSVSGRVISGRWEDGRLPQTLSELQGTFHASPAGWSVHDLQANYGDARLKLACGADGFAPTSPIWITGEAMNIPLSASLVEQLPEAAQKIWQKYQATGRIHSRFNLEYDGRQWHPQLDAEIEDATVTWYRYPYPLQQCRGKLHYTPQSLTFELVGQANREPVTVQGVIQNPGPEFTGRVELKSTGWIPLEDAMIQALDPAARRIVESLSARGHVQVHAAIERLQPGGSPRDLQLNVFVRDGWVNYERFPYPLQNVSGRIVLAEGVWQFQNFQGRNGSCTVQGVGTCRPGPSGDTNLLFTAGDVPLENELRDALPASTRVIWNDLVPRGSVDQVRVHSYHQHDGAPPRLQIILTETADGTPRPEAAPLTLQPTWFPYRWEEVTGTLTITDGQWKLDNFYGHHGETTVRFNAQGTSDAAQKWTADLANVSVERLQVTRELLGALPPSLSRSLQLFAEQGQFALQGSVQGVGQAPDVPPRWTWDVIAQIDQAALTTKIPISNIFGQARIAGVQQGSDFRLHALADIESLMVQQIQLVNLKGSIAATPQGITLGQVANQQLAGVTPTPLTCNVVGGELEIQAAIQNAANMPFQSRWTLRDADLRAVAREFGMREQSVTGRGFLDVGLAGNTDGLHTLQGAGNMRLRDATISELPQMIALLKILEARAPDRTAFTSSDSAFRIRGDRIYFDQIDLFGDAVTLKGDGEMDFQRKLNLQFYTIMGREARWIPAIRPWLGQASRQFLLIRVQGTMEQPLMTREVLPGLNESLRRFFPEQSAQQAPTAPPVR